MHDWRSVHVGFKRDEVGAGGRVRWRQEWRSTGTSGDAPAPKLPAAASPDRNSRSRRDRSAVRFAAGELSKDVWGVYIPALASPRRVEHGSAPEPITGFHRLGFEAAWLRVCRPPVCPSGCLSVCPPAACRLPPAHRSDNAAPLAAGAAFGERDDAVRTVVRSIGLACPGLISNSSVTGGRHAGEAFKSSRRTHHGLCSAWRYRIRRARCRTVWPAAGREWFSESESSAFHHRQRRRQLEAAIATKVAPVAPRRALRLALAYLYAQGEGDRWLFDHFWRAVTWPRRGVAGRCCRDRAEPSSKRLAINAIYRAVDAAHGRDHVCRAKPARG